MNESTIFQLLSGTCCCNLVTKVKPCRLGVLLSHPIQYYAPWFRHLASHLNIDVFYAHRQDARGQAAAGFDVAFEWDTQLLDGYRYRWLENVARQPGPGHFSGCDTPGIEAIVAREGFDAFLVFGWNYKSAWQTIRACRRHGVPVLMRGDSQLETPRSWVKSLAKYLPYRLMLPRLDGHLYVGQRNRAYLAYYGVPEERLFFAPHCVDNDFFAGRAREAEASGEDVALRDALGIPHDAFVLLFVGKFTPKKRPQDFLRACLRVFEASEGKNVHAVLVGDGPLAEALQVLVPTRERRVHFAGFRNQMEIPAFYAAVDALVLPSDGRETWGLVVNEAMACGLPAIVSDAAGCAPDLIEEGSTGYTYPTGDTASLAERILKVREQWLREPERIRTAVAEKVDAYSFEGATKGLQQALAVVAEPK